MAYKPELDGLRAISILLVIVSHAGFSHIVPGGFGVTVFFFVSGYLITSLLIDEYQKYGKINLSKFYLRRFWRLLPPMVFFLLLATSLIINVNGKVHISELSAALFYFANYFKLFFGFENVNGYPSPYNILWSLAIEEHFYIIFAPLIAFTFHSKKYFKVILIFLLLPLILRISTIALHPELLKQDSYTYFATETRLDSIAFGCFLAYIFSGKEFVRLKNFLLNNYSIVGALMLLLCTFLYRDLYFRETYRYTLQNLSLLIIIANLLFRIGESTMVDWSRGLLSNNIMAFIGKLSYSLYLQHWLALTVICLIFGAPQIKLQWQIYYWILSIALTLISYFLIEKPTLKFRKKYGSKVA